MASLGLRDRDAIITKEGLIFRVFGYTHPPEGYICDVEYAPAEIFKSENPKAYRTDGKQVFYKFYEDEGWKFVERNFPEHMVFHKPLNGKVVGVKHHNIAEMRKPEKELERLVAMKPKDELLKALQKVLEIVTANSSLPTRNFGVFGSLLHGFYHPKFSDIDLIVYGRQNAVKIREVLQELYGNRRSSLTNEFENDKSVKGKNWRFKNFSSQDFIWHQKRKLIYGIFNDKASRRTIKVEFEPVKEWNEIRNEYEETKKIAREGWIKAFLRVKDDLDGFFMPSLYDVEVLEIVDGPKFGDVKRVVSYLEEFRMQAWKDEVIYVEGNLEKVETSDGSFHQVTLTYSPRYYEQVLKVVK
ncbi:MAG: nucleotidyltransferase domain-containing protein [Candidatus Bathyarchaeia archaeon]